MKKKLLILAGMFIFFQFGFSLSCFFSHYELKDNTAIYNGLNEKVTMKNVNIETFKDLDGNFGKDKNHIYYTGKILKKIDAKTFEIVSNYIPIPDDPVWGIGCQTSYITEFKDKNGTYKLEDIQSGKLKLEE